VVSAARKYSGGGDVIKVAHTEGGEKNERKRSSKDKGRTKFAGLSFESKGYSVKECKVKCVGKNPHSKEGGGKDLVNRVKKSVTPKKKRELLWMLEVWLMA